MRSQKTAAVLIGALVVAIILFIVLSGGDDEELAVTTTPEAVTSASDPSGTSDSPDGAATGSESGTRGDDSDGEPQDATEAPTIDVVNGKPVGGVQEWTVKSGDTIRFVVTSTTAEEIHLHGYDVAKDVLANNAVEFEVPADLEGVFEVEIEDSEVQIAEISVVP